MTPSGSAATTTLTTVEQALVRALVEAIVREQRTSREAKS
jgi:hypothetical protein